MKARKRSNTTSCRVNNKILRLLRRPRAGFGTLEVVIIIAVLLSVALLFRSTLAAFAQNLIETVLGDQSVIPGLAINP